MNRPSYMNSNLNNGQEEFTQNSSNPIYNIEPRPYRCMIKHVEDNQEKSALIISFDIVEGELAGVFAKDSQGDFSKWNRKGKIWISYAEEFKDMFEAFITAVRKSNVNFVWDWNEQKLVGKNIVVLYGEEEFQTQDTKEIKISIKPRIVRSIEALNNGDIKYPLSVKRLSTKTYGNRNFQPNNYQNNNYNNGNYGNNNYGNNNYGNNRNNNYGNNNYGNNNYQNQRPNNEYDVEVDDNDLPF